MFGLLFLLFFDVFEGFRHFRRHFQIPLEMSFLFHSLKPKSDFFWPVFDGFFVLTEFCGANFSGSYLFEPEVNTYSVFFWFLDFVVQTFLINFVGFSNFRRHFQIPLEISLWKQFFKPKSELVWPVFEGFSILHNFA